MAHYVDGFVLPVPKKNVNAYRRMAQQASKIWRDHGALEYRECLGDDLDAEFAMPFPRGIKTSRAHRDRVNARVMKDPRISGMCDPKKMPFDCKRMLYGGFKTIVEA
jgi:uncharacterized protein YbaA (DUF1428 family)